MQDYKTMIAMCAEQEEKFQFEHFSREDALKIGLKLHENAKEQPVAVEITVNGLVVFRYFAEGAKPDSELWLARKRNAVDLMETSSLRFSQSWRTQARPSRTVSSTRTSTPQAAVSRSGCAAPA